MSASLTRSTLRMAIIRRVPHAGMLHHSDRASQYSDAGFRVDLSANGQVQSMSRTGNCYDNAVSESWFAAFKTEVIPDDGFHTKVEAELAVFEHIEGFYNTIRPHETLGGISPCMFESCAFAHA